MRVIYNGIDLGVLETYAFDGTPVYDDSGVDLLYTRYEIVVRCVFNGQAEVINPSTDSFPAPIGFQQRLNGPFVSYNASKTQLPSQKEPTKRESPTKLVTSTGGLGIEPKGAGINDVAKPRLRQIFKVPTPAGRTHQVVRDRLSMPRRKLFVFSGPGTELASQQPGEDARPSTSANIILESPEKKSVCDCKNGPIPKLFGIHTAIGDANTIFVDFSIETFINEGPQNGVNFTGALLSNRFAQTQIVDNDGYTTNITGGIAIFRTDRVYELLQSPDFNRPLMFIPIPPGFVREGIQVAGRPDVTGIEYSFRDRQVHVNFPAGPYARAASINVYHRQALVTGNLADSVFNFFEKKWNLEAQRNFAHMNPNQASEVQAGGVGAKMKKSSSAANAGSSALRAIKDIRLRGLGGKP